MKSWRTWRKRLSSVCTLSLTWYQIANRSTSGLTDCPRAQRSTAVELSTATMMTMNGMTDGRSSEVSEEVRPWSREEAATLLWRVKLSLTRCAAGEPNLQPAY